MSSQLSLKLSQPLRYSSDSFVRHRGVTSIIDAVLTLGAAPQFSTVYIHGVQCSGKTHLGVFLAGLLRHQGLPAQFISSSEVPVWHLERLPRERLKQGYVLVIDDADLSVMVAPSSGIFSDIEERVRGVGGLLVLLGGMEAHAIVTTGQIRSRLQAGISCSIGEPAEEDLDDLLEVIARQRGLGLSPVKRAFVLRRVARSIAGLTECVDRLERAGEESPLSTSFGILAEAASREST